MKIFKFEATKNYTLNTKEISFENIFKLNSKSFEILKLISKKAMYPKQIAKQLKIHEQNIYYYIKKLEKSPLIKISKQENINGSTANYYTTSSDSFYFKFKNFEESSKISSKKSKFLEPFIENGKLNSLIIVGSPDPHGPQKARSRDGYFGMDLALFLGTFLENVANLSVKLDTEVSEKELKENDLIVIGGPIVNKVSSLINKNMQIYFDEEKKGIYSNPSNKTYFEDQIGIINKFKSPFNNEKKIIFIAGIRNSGTKAAILTFLKHFKSIEKGNIYQKNIFSKVVLGVDLNSDGEVDEVDILE